MIALWNRNKMSVSSSRRHFTTSSLRDHRIIAHVAACAKKSRRFMNVSAMKSQK